MKFCHRVLSLLLFSVFLQSHALAIPGGPGSGSQSGQDVSILGTYSGVLIPTSFSSLPVVDEEGDTANSIGLFSIAIPQTGPGNGDFVAFSDGIIFAGTIVASANGSDGGKVSGILSASYEYPLQFLNGDGTVSVINVTAQINGSLEARVRDDQNNFQSASQTMEGEANMALSLGTIDEDGRPVVDDVLVFTVDGFRQSTQVVSAQGAFDGVVDNNNN